MIHKRVYFSNVLPSNHNHNNNTDFSGCDMRYNTTTIADHAAILRIVNLNEKMKLLKTLENPAISINQKIRIIKKDKPKIIILNLKAGGLFKDWESK